MIYIHIHLSGTNGIFSGPEKYLLAQAARTRLIPRMRLTELLCKVISNEKGLTKYKEYAT